MKDGGALLTLQSNLACCDPGDQDGPAADRRGAFPSGASGHLPTLQEKGKFVAPIDSTAFALADVNILCACIYHFDGFLNRLYRRIATERHLVV
jgi:hypothetical protein